MTTLGELPGHKLSSKKGQVERLPAALRKQVEEDLVKARSDPKLVGGDGSRRQSSGGRRRRGSLPSLGGSGRRSLDSFGSRGWSRPGSVESMRGPSTFGPSSAYGETAMDGLCVDAAVHSIPSTDPVYEKYLVARSGWNGGLSPLIRRSSSTGKLTSGTMSLLRAKYEGPQMNGSGSKEASLDDAVADFGEKEEEAIARLQGKLLGGYMMLMAAHAQDPDEVTGANLCGKNITGIIEADLLLFDNLQELDLSDNSVPLHRLGCIPYLNSLKMACNDLGSLKDFIYPMHHLTVLDLSYNFIPPDSLEILGQLTALKRLSLANNGLTTLPENMSFLTSVERLSIQGNHLGENIHCIHALGTIPRLRSLNLSDNQIASLPALDEDQENDSSGSWSRLVLLKLSENGIVSAADLSLLSGMKVLKEVVLVGCPILTLKRELSELDRLNPELKVCTDAAPDFGAKPKLVDSYAPSNLQRMPAGAETDPLTRWSWRRRQEQASAREKRKETHLKRLQEAPVAGPAIAEEPAGSTFVTAVPGVYGELRSGGGDKDEGKDLTRKSESSKKEDDAELIKRLSSAVLELPRPPAGAALMSMNQALTGLKFALDHPPVYAGVAPAERTQASRSRVETVASRVSRKAPQSTVSASRLARRSHKAPMHVLKGGTGLSTPRTEVLEQNVQLMEDVSATVDAMSRQMGALEASLTESLKTQAGLAVRKESQALLAKAQAEYQSMRETSFALPSLTQMPRARGSREKAGSGGGGGGEGTKQGVKEQVVVKMNE